MVTLMKVLIKCYGLPVSSMQTGDQQYYELLSGSTVDRLLYLLSSEGSYYDELRASVICINNKLVDLNTVLNEGDEVIIARIYAEG